MTKKLPFKFYKPEQSLGFMLWQVTNLWQRKIINALKELDLTHVQFVLLASTGWLTKQNENVTQVMVAQHAKTDIMMTSKVLRTLESKNLIERKEHPTDTRAKTLALTSKGQTLLKKAVVVVEGADDQFFDVLSGKESTVFLELLNTIVSRQQKKK